MKLKMKISENTFNRILLEKNQNYKTLSINSKRLPVTLSRISKGAVTTWKTADSISETLGTKINNLFEPV